MTLVLTKHHGLGNDFLVLLDVDGAHPLDADLARALCDRREGVGADGVIRVSAGTDGADLTMELRNADGSPAEMSGNGIRCLAQAVIDAGLVPGPEISVATGAGIRHLVVAPEQEPGLRQVTVDMGPAQVEQISWGRTQAARVHTGNPHLVLLDENDRFDLESLGGEYPDVNVELVAGDGIDRLRMRVWERGVGATLACGTGSVASAAAARQWGIVGSTVVVANPGGELTVDLKDETTLLTGPARFIARVEVP